METYYLGLESFFDVLIDILEKEEKEKEKKKKQREEQIKKKEEEEKKKREEELAKATVAAEKKKKEEKEKKQKEAEEQWQRQIKAFENWRDMRAKVNESAKSKIKDTAFIASEIEKLKKQVLNLSTKIEQLQEALYFLD